MSDQTCVEVLPPGADMDDPDVRAERRKRLHASEVATVLGVGYPGDSPYAVWLEKTGRLNDVPEAPPTEAMERGHDLEPVVANIYARKHPEVQVVPAATYVRPDLPWLAASPDRRLLTPDGWTQVGLLECKAPGYWSGRDWTSADDEVPARHLTQAYVQMVVTGVHTNTLAALLGGQRYVERPVDWDDELAAMIVEQAHQWWDTHVVHGREPDPDGASRTTELLSALYDVATDEIVDLGADGEILRAANREAAEAAKDAKARQDEYSNRLRAAMGAASVAVAGDRVLATWRQDGQVDEARLRAEYHDAWAACRRRVTVLDLAKLKAEHPDAYAACRGRTLRVKDSKPIKEGDR
jgi:putative phage-type endonuclease